MAWRRQGAMTVVVLILVVWVEATKRDSENCSEKSRMIHHQYYKMENQQDLVTEGRENHTE